MKKKTKTYFRKRSVTFYGKQYLVQVYGELFEDGSVNGLCVLPVHLTRDGKQILGTDIRNSSLFTLGRPYARTKSFNMGWAILTPEDTFDEKVGIELCKKRFSVSPIYTQSGNFLTDDMIIAIMENELNFIAKNFHKFFTPHLITETRKQAEEYEKFKCGYEGVTEGEIKPEVADQAEIKPEPKVEEESNCESEVLGDYDPEEELSGEPEITGDEEENVFTRGIAISTNDEKRLCYIGINGVEGNTVLVNWVSFINGELTSHNEYQPAKMIELTEDDFKSYRMATKEEIEYLKERLSEFGFTYNVENNMFV